MDPTVHPVPPEAASGGDGCVRGGGVSDLPGRAGKVAASTQNQALNAIVFLYRKVLKKDFGWLEGVERAKKPARLPVVFTREEARVVLARLDGIRWMMASLLYGSAA